MKAAHAYRQADKTPIFLKVIFFARRIEGAAVFYCDRRALISELRARVSPAVPLASRSRLPALRGEAVMGLCLKTLGTGGLRALGGRPSANCFTCQCPARGRSHSFGLILVVTNQAGGNRDATSGPALWNFSGRPPGVTALRSEGAWASVSLAARPKASGLGVANSELSACMLGLFYFSCAFSWCRTNRSQLFARAIRPWRETGRSSGSETLSS